MLCRNCGSPCAINTDLCPACTKRTPGCVVCGLPIDEHSLTYSKEKYPKPICPVKKDDGLARA